MCIWICLVFNFILIDPVQNRIMIHIAENMWNKSISSSYWIIVCGNKLRQRPDCSSRNSNNSQYIFFTLHFFQMTNRIYEMIYTFVLKFIPSTGKHHESLVRKIPATKFWRYLQNFLSAFLSLNSIFLSFRNKTMFKTIYGYCIRFSIKKLLAFWSGYITYGCKCISMDGCIGFKRIFWHHSELTCF